MRRRYNIPLFIALLFLIQVIFTPASAASPSRTPSRVVFYPGASVRFEHLTIDDGISQNAGLALLQDQQGYLWVGTQDGLNRYDGYSFTIFKNDPDDPHSLSYNSVISLYEDSQGYVWVGTWGGGLNRYDPVSRRFTRYLPDAADHDTLSHPIVTSILEDPAGNLWVGTLGGLDRLDPATGKFTHFRSDPNDSASLSSNAISTIYPAGDGSLWVGTGAYSTPGNGINRFDPATGKAERLTSSTACLQGAHVSSIAGGEDGSLWIGYGGYGLSGGGLDHWYPKTGACDHFDSSPEAVQITDNNVTRLLVDQDSRLWVSTWSGGLWRMEPGRSNQIHVYRHDPADPDSLSSDNAYTLLQDRSGVLWVGTLSSGLNKLNFENMQFRYYKHNPSDPNSIASNHVGAFAETEDGTLWVGTWETGLARFDPAQGVFTHYRPEADNPESLSSDLVMSLHPGRDNSLWVGTLGGGLNHLDPRTGIFTRYQHDPEDPDSLIEDEVTSIFTDADGRLWVGTLGGLDRLDPGAKGFVHYPVDPAANGKISGPVVSLAATGNTLWVGTWGMGLFSLDLSQPANLVPEQAVFSLLKHDPANSNSLSEDSIWTITPTSDGMLWLGTQGGLNRYNLETGEFKAYTEKSGLRNTTIMGIMEDPDGLLWITTNNGLARFDPRSEQFTIYDKTDGLQGNEFNSNGYFLSPSTGEMYVGGVNGFNVFNPLELQENTTPPSIVITDFKLFNESSPFDPRAESPIVLSYQENFISFEFAALDYHSPGKNTYAYMLEGFDRGWIQSGTRRYTSYTNLPGGDYTFRVKGANSDGIWNETGEALRIRVVPPFWQTRQFILLAVLLGLGVVVGGTQWRVRSAQADARRLEKVVEQRTVELRQTNSQLEVEVEQRKLAEARLAQQAADALQESNERFRAVFENAAVGVAVMTLDRKIVQVNQTVERLTGYSAAELEQINPSMMVIEEDRFIDRELFVEMVDGKRAQYMIEKRYFRKDGSVFWGRINFSVVYDGNHKPLYIIGMIEDITDEKMAAERLAAQEAEYRKTLEQRIAQRTDELNQANQLLQQKAAQEAVSAERSRLARDLHDAVTQTLFSATMIAEVLPELWEMNVVEGKRRMEELRQLTRGALAEMRSLLVELRPNALVEAPLPTLLRQLAEAVTGRARIQVQLSVDGDRKLPPDVQVALYRIAQEALNNMIKHSKATQAFVTLRLDDPVRLTVADNGAGFDPAAITGDHLGLKIMRERAEAIGAKMSMYSEPGEGTQVSVIWQAPI